MQTSALVVLITQKLVLAVVYLSTAYIRVIA